MDSGVQGYSTGSGYDYDVGSRMPTEIEINWGTQVVEPLKALVVKVISFIPVLIEAVMVLVIGWLISKIVSVVIKKFLIAIQFDKIADNTGISEVIEQNKIGMPVSVWVSKLFYWFGIITSWIVAFNTLKLRLPAFVLGDIGDFLSMIFMGMFILLLGLFLSIVISSFVETTARRLKIANPGLHAGIVRWAMILFTFVAALSHFGFPAQFLVAALSVVGITLCVTFAIAFGIGGIAWTPKVLDKLSK